MEIGIVLSKRCNVSQQEIRPLLVERSGFSPWVWVCVVERECSFVARARILRLLIPVVLEAEFERMFAVTDGKIVKPIVVSAEIPIRSESEKALRVSKVQIRNAGHLHGKRHFDGRNHAERVFRRSQPVRS